MEHRLFFVFFCICASLTACTIERAEEQITDWHVEGIKKTSLWVFPNGEILKRNEWYHDGAKEFEIPYKDGAPHGKFKRWTIMGDLALTGYYQNGKRDGKWTSYYTNKAVEAQRYYKDDHPVGDWEGWYFNREKAFEEHYDKNGNATGIWKKWYNNGILFEETNCFKNESDTGKTKKPPQPGFFKRYARDCKVLEHFECIDGVKNGIYKLYYESFGDPDTTNGKCNQSHLKEEGLVYDDSIFYPSAYYRADGSIMKRIELNEERKIHKIQWFDENNNVLRESIFDAQGTDGQTAGTGIAYGTCEHSSSLFCAETSFVHPDFPSGILDSSSLSFRNAFQGNIGKFPASLRYIKPGHELLYEELWDMGNDSTAEPRISESRSFYPDSVGGKMASRGFWKNGKKNGVWRNWYANGILKDSLTYVNDERVGDQFGYDDTGKLTIHKTEHGRNGAVVIHLAK